MAGSRPCCDKQSESAFFGDTDCEIRASVFTGHTADACLRILYLRSTVEVYLVDILRAVLCAQAALLAPFAIYFDFVHILHRLNKSICFEPFAFCKTCIQGFHIDCVNLGRHSGKNSFLKTVEIHEIRKTCNNAE